MSNYSRIRRGPMAADAFTQIRNAVFRDPRLSAKAMGIFGNISTHRDGWGITPEGISTQMRDGVDAIRSGLKELEKCGYLQRIRTRDPETGRIGPSEYYITDQPETVTDTPSEENRRSDPHMDFPHVGEPHVVNPPHKKTSTSSKKTVVEKTKDSLSPVVGTAEDARGRASVTERERLAAPTDKTTTALPGQRAGGVDKLESVPAGVPGAFQRFQAPVPAAPQQPQTVVSAPQQPAPALDAAARVVDAYTAALGRPILPGTRERMQHQAAAALAVGYPEAWLADRAREMAPHGWTDLARHVERSTVPLSGATRQTAKRTLPEWCGKCGTDYGNIPRTDPVLRQVEDEHGNRRPCPDCHPANAPAPVSREQQQVDAMFDRAMQRAQARDRVATVDQRVADGFALAERLEAEGC